MIGSTNHGTSGAEVFPMRAVGRSTASRSGPSVGFRLAARFKAVMVAVEGRGVRLVNAEKAEEVNAKARQHCDHLR